MKSALTVVLFRLFTIGVFVDGKEASNVSVMEGDSVTLKSGVTDVQTGDDIEWRFNGKRIDKSGDTLQLNSQTEDLKISNIRTTDSGLYKVTISRTTGSPSDMEFNVKVSGAAKAVILNVGDFITLLTDVPDIQRVDEIRWRFGQQKSSVAEINRMGRNFIRYDGPDERFRDRLELDNQTGSLIITNTTTTDSGLYEADISSGKHTIHKSFSVTVRGDMTSVSVKKGESVTLQIVTEIQSDDLIVWMFGNINLAEFNKTEPRFNVYHGPDERFRGRLDLNHKTGYLNITNTRTTGDYELKIISRRHIINRRITVTVSGVFGESVSVKEGESVTLSPELSEIKKDDVIDWRFRDSLIARVRNNNIPSVYEDALDWKFRDRLKLNGQTGNLTITNFRNTDAGDYEVSNSINTFKKTFSVTAVHSGLSPGEIAGIVVGVLVLLVAAAVGVIFYLKKGQVL